MKEKLLVHSSLVSPLEKSKHYVWYALLLWHLQFRLWRIDKQWTSLGQKWVRLGNPQSHIDIINIYTNALNGSKYWRLSANWEFTTQTIIYLGSAKWQSEYVQCPRNLRKYALDQFRRTVLEHAVIRQMKKLFQHLLFRLMKQSSVNEFLGKFSAFGSWGSTRL